MIRFYLDGNVRKYFGFFLKAVIIAVLQKLERPDVTAFSPTFEAHAAEAAAAHQLPVRGIA